ncbi:hypothetical protein CAC42_1792 [Sphaceloma murrayae]|uniref:Uncharacterized protein n=1 Tax=Sphaceloma murrayae TaxID=2082308 RepID=A0A2K1QVG8_9PEZI|nr:hypothetical protein CAC42_1792 [Sphaceloma murrayae]
MANKRKPEGKSPAPAAPTAETTAPLDLRRPASTPKPKPKSKPAAPVAVPQRQEEDVVSAVIYSFFHVYFAALHGALSQLMLGPVYGSLVASDQHRRILSTGLLFGFMLKPVFPQIKVPKLKLFLPLVPFYIPLMQKQLFRYSMYLGATNGPVVTEFLSLFPFVFLSALCASEELSSLRVFREQSFLNLIPAVGAYFAVISAEPIITEYLTSFAQYSDYLTRVWIYVGSSAVGLSQTVPRIAMTALPAIWYNLQYNPHLQWTRTTQGLSADLQTLNWTLLDRKESITGYVSVLENTSPAFRILRCDHSLLGGEWILNDQMRAEGVTGTEPIYAVFEMLEAVRLVETMDRTKKDQDKQALVIGLGIGTAPKALSAHGVDTTIVELDPAVYHYAVKYFDLPTNITAHIQDAVTWTNTKAMDVTYRNKYDFVLHDVFTGGAEPLALFTQSFIVNLRNLLSVDGVIAINYAGDISVQPTKQILNTINTVFNGRCRIFRDLVPEDPEADTNNFTNMVVFCLHPNSKNDKKLPVFRRALEADYLSSLSRKQHLEPDARNELRFPTAQEMEGEKIKILTEKDIEGFRERQLESAKRHWRIMRDVMPSVVWELW